MPNVIKTTVTGGYNGGATITVLLDGTSVFTATGDSPYNLVYTPSSGSFSIGSGAVTVTITPPPNNQGKLTITYSGAVSETYEVNHQGANTSYGYNFSATKVIGATPPIHDDGSPTFKLMFLDGTFITLRNESNPDYLTYPREYTFAFPNLVFGDYNDTQSYVTKTDFMGNTWEIHEDEVVINGRSISVGGQFKRFYLGYDPTNQRLYVHYSALTQPYLMETGDAGNANSRIIGSFYDSVTGSQDYPTIGDVISEGGEYMDIQGWYAINDMQPLSSEAGQLPVHNMTAYAGFTRKEDQQLENTYLFSIWVNGDALAGDTYISLDLDNSLANYDPDVSPPTPPTPGEDDDPYDPGGVSTTGGGAGNFDNTSDTIGIPSDPSISATDTGFMTVFATNLSGLQSLANSLWADLFPETFTGESLHETAEALKNIVASPYDAILGCHIVPVAVPTGTSKNVKLYGVLPSSVSLPVASTQWVTVDCGTLAIHEHWGAYLDYSPYTKVTSLYLPFVGVVSVDIDMIMDKTIGVKYKIDIVSGQCVAFITVGGSVEFQYQGHCAVSLPVTTVDWSNTVSAGLGLIGSVTNIVGTAVGGAMAGGVGGALSGAVTGAMGQAGAVAQNVMNSKPDIKSGSGIGGSAGLMGCKKPFLIIERPRQSLPKKGSNSQNHWTGYPSNTAQKLGDLSGYTEVSRIFVNRTDATAQEKEEIERLLHEGVYL